MPVWIANRVCRSDTPFDVAQARLCPRLLTWPLTLEASGRGVSQNRNMNALDIKVKSVGQECPTHTSSRLDDAAGRNWTRATGPATRNARWISFRQTVD